MFRSVANGFVTFFSSVFSGFESPQERKKFSILAVLFGLTIGVYWVLRALKDGVFITMVGTNWQPTAKMIVMVAIVPLVLSYEWLVSRYSRHQMLYGISMFYAVLTAVFAYFILHPTIGMGNTVADTHRYLGWLFYVFVESFGAIMVMLFWSFVADTTTPESAKRGYSLIVFGAQLGGIVGPLLAQMVMPEEGLMNIQQNVNGSGKATMICVVVLMMIPLVVYYFMHNVSKDQMKGFHGDYKKPLEGTAKPGFFEGLRLLITKPYMLGIFIVISFYQIILTFLDFQFKVLAGKAYVGDALTLYLFKYSVWTNILATACIVFGAGKIANRLGLAKTLILLPILISIAVVTLYFNPVLHIALVIMMFTRGVNYALNQPAKEQLYIPTTKDSKYKGKAWIDGFGSRFSKGLGSLINDRAAALGPQLFACLTLTISFGLVGVWIFAALFLGKTHAQAVKEDRPVC